MVQSVSKHFFHSLLSIFSFQLYLVGSWEKSILVIAVGWNSCQDLDGDGQLSMAEFWEGDMAPGGRWCCSWHVTYHATPWQAWHPKRPLHTFLAGSWKGPPFVTRDLFLQAMMKTEKRRRRFKRWTRMGMETSAPIFLCGFDFLLLRWGWTCVHLVAILGFLIKDPTVVGKWVIFETLSPSPMGLNQLGKPVKKIEGEHIWV